MPNQFHMAAGFSCSVAKRWGSCTNFCAQHPVMSQQIGEQSQSDGSHQVPAVRLALKQSSDESETTKIDCVIMYTIVSGPFLLYFLITFLIKFWSLSIAGPLPIC